MPMLRRLPLLPLLLASAAFASVPEVKPVLETQPVFDTDAENAPAGSRLGDADDPAIWLHPTDPARSLVAGALKDGGLDVYDLSGAVVQSFSPEGARYNNVDVLYGFPLAGEATDLFVASDRNNDLLAVYAIDPASGTLADVTDPQSPLIFTPEGEASNAETTAYGIATYRDSASGRFYAFVSRRETNELAQLELVARDGRVGWEAVRTVKLTLPETYDGDNPQVEGMVVDAELGIAYLAQEQVGIWKLTADPASTGQPELIHPLDDTVLTADAEGLTIYYGPDGTGYLLASSQGSSTLVVYARDGNNRYLGSFQVAASGDLDGVEESDGSMVLNVPLGEAFPQGLLVVHDGLNDPELLLEDEGELENVSTAFKFVPWQRIAEAFDPPLLIDTESFSPR